MTNKAHPPATPTAIVAEIVSAPLAVSDIAESKNPLAVIAALPPPPVEPEDFPVDIDVDDEIYALRMAGYTARQISHNMTKRTGRVWTTKQVDEAYMRIGRENVTRGSEQMAFAAQLELDRIEAALKALWPDVQSGNLAATDRFLKLSERKSKMLGLDSPDVAVSLRLGSPEVDYGALSTEELKLYLDLQRKVSTKPKELPVAVPRRLGSGE